MSIDLLLTIVGAVVAICGFFWGLRGSIKELFGVAERQLRHLDHLSKDMQAAREESSKEHRELLEFISRADDRHIASHDKLADKLTLIGARQEAKLQDPQ